MDEALKDKLREAEIALENLWKALKESEASDFEEGWILMIEMTLRYVHEDAERLLQENRNLQ